MTHHSNVGVQSRQVTKPMIKEALALTFAYSLKFVTNNGRFSSNRDICKVSQRGPNTWIDPSSRILTIKSSLARRVWKPILKVKLKVWHLGCLDLRFLKF